MKQAWLIVLVAVFLPLGWIGCQTMPHRSVPEELVPFTARHMEDFSDYLEEVQFYISRRIVLHRSVESETKDVTGAVHTMQIEKDMEIQSITFPAKTPGVLMGIDEGVLNVQFEPALEGGNRAIPFRQISLAGGEDQADKVVFVFDAATLAYDGSEYQVHYEEEDVAVTEEDKTVHAEKARSEQGQFITRKRYPILLINPVRTINRFKEDNRVVPGVWEEDPPD